MIDRCRHIRSVNVWALHVDFMLTLPVSSFGLSFVRHSFLHRRQMGCRLSSIRHATSGKEESAEETQNKKCEVCVVGCGVPGRGMGWFHAKNIIDGEVSSAVLTDVVEPWFLGKGSDSPDATSFKEWSSQHPEVRFHKAVADMPKPSPGTSKIALIAGRTADNPHLLEEVIAQGCQTVYLEKPGAPTVEQLEQMATFSKSKDVKVYMGYNKCVTKYVLETLEQEKKIPNCSTTYVHSNDYKEEELHECFERNSEGMLRNQAVHELCLLVTYYGLRANNIASVKPDYDFSSCQTLKGYTDFDKLGFTVTTEEGRSVSIYADRCGGSYSEAIVRDADGNEVFRSRTPDPELLKAYEAEQAAHPNYMPYFILQHDDYITLKERVCRAALKKSTPPGVATIDVAIETLKVADKLTPLLQKELLQQQRAAS